MLDLKQMKVALEQLETEKRIPKARITDAIEQSLAAAYKKDYGEKGQIVRCKLDFDTGVMEFEQVKVVVDETTVRMPKFDENGDEIKEEILFDAEDKAVDSRPKYNEEHHILMSESKLIKKDSNVGDELVFPLDSHDDFGRIAAQTAKQVVIQKLREAERDSVVQEFGGKEGSIVTGLIQRIERGIVYVDLGRATAVLPLDEQIKNERYFPGMRVRAYLYSLDEGSKNGFSMRLSRTHPKFLIELFKLEAPEIASGIVEIKAIAREPGNRSKIAVFSNDPSIDPIGTCVGQRGSRVSTITNELNGEKIDIIDWSEEQDYFIAEALKPADVESIELNTEEKKATVYVTEEEQSLAIGKGGQNVRLAARLTGWKIDIVSTQINEIEGEQDAEYEDDAQEVAADAQITQTTEAAEAMEESTAEIVQEELGTAVIEDSK